VLRITACYGDAEVVLDIGDGAPVPHDAVEV